MLQSKWILNIPKDYHSTLLYGNIYDGLAEKIASGEYKIGEPRENIGISVDESKRRGFVGLYQNESILNASKTQRT